MKHSEKHYLKLDILAHIGMGISLGMGAEYFGVLATRYGASAFMLAIIGSAPFLANLFAPLWSKQSKQWGAKRLLIFSFFASALVILFMINETDPLIFSLFVLLFFLLYGISDPIYVVLAEDTYSQKTTDYLGKTEGIFSLSHALGSGIIGRLIDLFGNWIAFVLAIAGNLLAGFSFLFFPNEKTSLNNDQDVRDSSSFRLFKENKDIRYLVLTFMIPGIGMLLMIPALPIIEVRLAHLSNTQIGILFGLNGIVWFLFSILWGKLADRFNIIFIIFQLSFLSLGAMALFYTYTQNFWGLLLGNIFCGIGGSAIAVGWRVQAIRFKQYETEDIAGLHLFTCGVRGLIVPFIGAFIIHQFGVNANMLIALGFLFSGFILFFQLRKKNIILNEKF